LLSLIESKTNAFIRYIESLPPSASESPIDNQQQTPKEGNIKSQIVIQFYEKVTRRASWWATKAAESEVCWEKWELNCDFFPPSRNERGTIPPPSNLWEIITELSCPFRKSYCAIFDGTESCCCVTESCDDD